MSKPQELSLTIQDKRLIADGVVSIVLGQADREPLPHWTPGAHVGLHLPDGTMRQYSLCGQPTDTEWTIAVLKEPAGRGGSRYIHDTLAIGDHIQALGPRNNFELREADSYLFIAGGIGITPILAMIAEVDHAGKDWRLLYGGRNRRSMAFVERLNKYGSRVQLVPQDECGILDLDEILETQPPDRAIYSCGPEALLSAIEQRCTRLGRPHPHVERFKAVAEPAVGSANSAFTVELRKSGLTLHVGEEDSIVSTVRAAGVTVSTSCMNGTCGTCETKVIEGIPEHRDSLLSEDERRESATMMICCSRSLSESLVLDL